MKKLYASQYDIFQFKRLLEYTQNEAFHEAKKPTCKTVPHISPSIPESRKKTSSNVSSNTAESETQLQLKRQLEKELEMAKQKIEQLELEIYKKNNQPIQLHRKMPIEMSRDSFFETPLAFEECKKPRLLDSNLSKSIDSTKMRSTLMNLDLEELCKCFARAIV